MGNDGDLGAERFKAMLLRQLAGSGIEEDRIDVQYQSDLQDYEVNVGGGALADAQIELLRRATRLGGCLTFSDAANSLRLSEAQQREGRELMKTRAARLVRELVGLPRYRPSETTLADFAVELEAYCGFEPRTGLEALDDKTLRLHVTPPASFDRFQRLTDAVTAALAEHDDVQLVVIGHAIEAS